MRLGFIVGSRKRKNSEKCYLFLWLYPQEIRETVDISLLCVLAHIKVNLRGINSKRKIYIFFV